MQVDIERCRLISPTLSQVPRLRDSDTVRGGSKRGISSLESLRPSTNTDKVLTVREPIVGHQPREEVLHVAAEARDLARRNERVHSHLAVWTLVDVPGGTGDGGGSNGSRVSISALQSSGQLTSSKGH